jgi:hypothetical protein
MKQLILFSKPLIDKLFQYPERLKTQDICTAFRGMSKKYNLTVPLHFWVMTDIERNLMDIYLGV